MIYYYTIIGISIVLLSTAIWALVCAATGFKMKCPACRLEYWLKRRI